MPNVALGLYFRQNVLPAASVIRSYSPRSKRFV